MGFRPIADEESITASFHCVLVYEVRGITVATQPPSCLDGKLGEICYRLALGENLNETSRALTTDIYADDEEAWKTEKQARGPFLLVQIGPSPTYTVTSGHVQDEADGTLTTFETFKRLRSDLDLLEEKVAPPLLTSLVCNSLDPDHHIQTRKLDRASFGVTTEGRRVRDIRFSMSGSGYISRGLSQDGATRLLANVADIAPSINHKAAKFYALGMHESDELKQFLYYFLAIEISVHAAFKQVDHHAAVSQLMSATQSTARSAIELIQRQTSSLNRLSDRFAWCACINWAEIGEDEIELFKKLKLVRDQIAHGTKFAPPSGYARMAQELAKKILRAGSK